MKYTAAMIVLLAAPLVSAPPQPSLVSEINLSQFIPARPGFAPFATFAFSPDEKWLAVAIGVRQFEPRKFGGNVDLGPSSVLLVPVNGTVGRPVQIDPGLRPFGNPAWSPDSATFLVRGFVKTPPSPSPGGIAKLWNLRGDELMQRSGPGLATDGPVSGIFGFVDSKHLLGRRVPARGMPSAFETIDLQGQVVDTWTVPKHWTVADISPERGLLAILTDRASKTLVIDRASKKVLLTRSNPSGYAGYGYSVYVDGAWQYFTENGKTLCSVGSVGTGRPDLSVPTECWDVDSGRKIAQFRQFPGGAPAAASARGSSLVLTRDIAFPRAESALVFPSSERVVWDFCSGAEIAAWEVPQIANSSHILDHVAISSSGRYVAETAGALLRIYQLP